MKHLTKFHFPFKVNTSFIMIMIVSIALGYIEQFFIMFCIVTFHELAHVAVVTFFKLKTKKIIFTALGEIAVIQDMELLQPYKKMLIILAGPLANLMAGFFLLWVMNGDSHFAMGINFALAIFNMLPVYPLDGGRLLQVVLGNQVGVMKGNKILLYMSRGIGAFIMLIGGLQVVLYPFNISLLCLGLYIYFVNKKEYFNNTFEFYKIVVLQRNKVTKKTRLPAKYFLISEQAEIKMVINMLCWDIFYFFHVHRKGEIQYVLNEQHIVDYVKNYGLHGTLEDIAKHFGQYQPDKVCGVAKIQKIP